MVPFPIPVIPIAYYSLVIIIKIIGSFYFRIRGISCSCIPFFANDKVQIVISFFCTCTTRYTASHDFFIVT